MKATAFARRLKRSDRFWKERFRNKLVSSSPLAAIASSGLSFAALASRRGESVNSCGRDGGPHRLPHAYRFYSKFIADKVLQLDPLRPTLLSGTTMAWTTCLPTSGPLRPPLRGDRRRGTRWSDRCLPRRWAFRPAALDPCWGGDGRRRAGFHRPLVRFGATARSLGEMIKMDLGPVPGTLALVGVLAIMIIISRYSRW